MVTNQSSPLLSTSSWLLTRFFSTGSNPQRCRRTPQTYSAVCFVHTMSNSLMLWITGDKTSVELCKVFQRIVDLQAAFLQFPESGDRKCYLAKIIQISSKRSVVLNTWHPNNVPFILKSGFYQAFVGNCSLQATSWGRKVFVKQLRESLAYSTFVAQILRNGCWFDGLITFLTKI